MKEFLFFIMSEGKPLANASPEEMQQHIRKVGDYIRKNVKEGKFLGAQPLESNGVTIGGSKGNIFDGPYIESKEVISGYYHVLAKDMEDLRIICLKISKFINIKFFKFKFFLSPCLGR